MNKPAVCDPVAIPPLALGPTMPQPAASSEEFPFRALQLRALQVIGAGAAGAGIVVAADRLGMLNRLVERGLVLLDRAPAGQLSSLDYDIESNSPGIEFLSQINPGGIFADLLKTPEARALADATNRTVPLRTVSRLIAGIIATYEDYAQRRSDIAPVRHGVSIHRLCILRDGSFMSFDETGYPLVRSRAAVLALGGEQVLDRRIVPRRGDGEEAPLLGSDEVLRGQRDEICQQALASGGRIAVIGGAHSGWSVVERLLRLGEGRLAPGQILVANRGPTAVYFSSVQEALAAGMTPRLDQICPETGKVHRFDGLRGPARDLYDRFAAGQIPAVEPHGPMDPSCQIDKLALVINAAGYRPRQIQLRDHRGTPLVPEVEHGNLRLTPQGAVICQDRGPIHNLFGLGLGHAVRRYGAHRVGVNVFHGDAASRILQECDPGARAPAPGTTVAGIAATAGRRRSTTEAFESPRAR